MWYGNPEFNVQCLRPIQRSRLANVSKEIGAYIRKNRWKMENGKLRAMKIVTKLLSPTLSIANSRPLRNPSFKLLFGRVKATREYIDEKVFNEIVKDLKDMDRVQASHYEMGTNDQLYASTNNDFTRGNAEIQISRG